MKCSSMTTVLDFVSGAASQATSFNMTASSAANDAVWLECWQLDAPPNTGRGAVALTSGILIRRLLAYFHQTLRLQPSNDAVQVQ